MRLHLCLACAALLGPVGLAAQTTLPLKHAPRPTSPDISAADLMTRLYIFSDDSMQGREAGAIGDVRGTNYIAAEIKRMGLVPAGDDGTYFQTIPLETVSLDEASTFSVDGAPLAIASDYLPLTRDSLRASLPIVYGGLLGDTAATLSQDQARGKLVVLAAQNGADRRRLFRARPDVPGAAAFAIVTPDDGISPQLAGYLRRPRTMMVDNPSGAPTETPRLLVSASAAARMFSTPLNQLTPGATGGTASIDLRYTVTPVARPARNVIGIIPGSDARLRGEYVAIGAHNDHIGMISRPVDHDSLRIWNHIVRPEGADDGGKQATPQQQAEVDRLLAAYRAAHPGSERLDSIDNGADDDGSGTVAALEIAQKIASLEPRPKRSILFVWHTGEEKGLLGSHYFTDHPTVPRDSIVAQLNMDMVGRGDASDETGRTKDGQPLHGGPRYLQLVGSRRLSTELGDLVEAVNIRDHHGLVFDYSLDANGHPANIYCRSDHYEYARWGIPIVFFTTGLHSDYHQVTDEAEYIDYPHMARVVNFVEDVAVHVADLDHRPVVDHAKPDPYGSCRQ
jgi:Peptidase family M28